MGKKGTSDGIARAISTFVAWTEKRRNHSILKSLALVVLLSGCAAPIDNVFRPVPAVFVPTGKFALGAGNNNPVPKEFGGNDKDFLSDPPAGADAASSTYRIIAFDQYENPEIVSTSVWNVGGGPQTLKRIFYTNSWARNALYLSVDVSGVLTSPESVDKAGRNTLMQLAICLSDRNFATYLSRSAAYARYRKLYGGLLRDGVTAGSGIAAFFSPFTALGLSVANVSSAANSIDTGIDKQMLGDFAIEILHTSALEQRLKFRNYLEKQMPKTIEQYPVLRALDDLHEYDQRGNLLTVLRQKKMESNASLLALEKKAYPGLGDDGEDNAGNDDGGN